MVTLVNNGRHQSNSGQKEGLWTKLKKKFRTKKKLIIEDEDRLVEGKTQAHEDKKRKRKEKRKATLKQIGKTTLAVCRYIGMGAAISSPSFGNGYNCTAPYPDIGPGLRPQGSYYF